MMLKILQTAAAIAWFIAPTAQAADASADDGNLLVNPGLESTAAFNWDGSMASAQRVTTAPYAGKYCLQVIDTSDSRGQANMALVAVTPGPYFVEAWLRQDPDAAFDGHQNGGVTVGVQFFDAGGAYLKTQEIGTTSSTVWTRLGGTVQAPKGAASASIRVLPTSPDETTPTDRIGPVWGGCFADSFYFAPLDKAATAGRLTAQRNSQPRDKAGKLDESLVIHYRFDTDPGDQATDFSGFGNHGKIINGQFLQEANGRRGVLRLDGEPSYIDCGNTESMQFAGDVTFEMWVRFNKPMNKPGQKWHILYGEYPPGRFCFMMPYGHTLAVWYRNLENTSESSWLPVDAQFIREKWTHIAVVSEFPRCRFYQNGQLYRDAYMPLPGMVTNTNAAKYHQHIGGGPDAVYAAPIDLTEFRLYRRALSAEEIAAHANDRAQAPTPTAELAAEPDWYKGVVTLRFTIKGGNFAGQTVNFRMHAPGSATASTTLTGAFPQANRYVATTTIPMSQLTGKSFRAAASLVSRDGQPKLEASKEVVLEKPEWVHSQAGISEKVLTPWIAVTTETTPAGAVNVGVWGRRYTFDSTQILKKVESGGAAILKSPVTLTGQADGKALEWQEATVTLTAASDAGASIEQVRRSDAADLRVLSRVEYDGFTTIECDFKARQDISLEELTLEIPMLTKFARFCAGDKVLPKKPNISMSEMYRGAVTSDLSFKFGPTVWLGTDQSGLSWQAESDEDWHYNDPQKAIEILPRGDTTYLRAHFVDVPTQLAAGKSLRYKFALQATPVKPLYRDAWSLRIGRSEPYGADLKLPDKTIDGKPALEYLAGSGLRHLFINVNDEFPWPMPKRKVFSDALLRLNNAAHAAGLKIYCYSIHARVPVMRPEFDIYGSSMLLRPARQYMQAVGPMERPGPIPWDEDMLPLPQGSADFCQKSAALQDAYMHALKQRVTIFGDDGVYLDGSYCAEPCVNTAHGCGYYDEDGALHPTYPVFAARQFMKRIYTIVHESNPDGVVDLHSSFYFNVSGIAYADVIWTGEQWYELREKGAGYIAGTLTLDMFRTEFTGWPLGVPAETLTYRLGPPNKVAATSLLHDISPRLSTNAYDNLAEAEDPYYTMIPTIWKLREDFGMADAEKLFYWENQDYVSVSPDRCYTTLFKHPTRGVLAIVSNLSRESQTVTVHFNMDTLQLRGKVLEAINALTGDSLTMTSNGEVSIPLGSEDWRYIWLRP